MKKNKRFNVFAVILLLVTGLLYLGACAENTTDTENLCLISNGEVKFRIVASSSLDIKSKGTVSNLIGELRELGLDIPENPVPDTDVQQITSCEIIFGTDVKNREDCSVDEHEVGSDGYVIKIVGDRVIVAAGSSDAFKEAVEQFKKKVLGITARTDTLADATVNVKRTYEATKPTEYPISRISVGGKSLEAFCFSFNSEDATVTAVANRLRQLIYERSGFWLPLAQTPDGERAEQKIVVRTVSDLGDDNFKVYVSEGDLVMECTSPGRMMKGAEAFADKYLNESLRASSFDENDVFVYDAVALRYSEFGAAGDGKTDDFAAIIATHQAANSTGVKVMADDGAKYYLGPASYGKEAKVNTDVDWGNAEFIIDDAYIAPQTDDRRFSIFALAPTKKSVTYYAKADPDANSFSLGLALSIGDTELPEELKKFITEPCIVIPYNQNQQIFVRYGNNTGSAEAHELLLVNADGTIDPSTPVMWDYSDITKIVIHYTSDSPITLEGGIFTTRANQVYSSFTEDELKDGWAEGSQYYYFARNLFITRSHVTVKNVKHYVEREGSEGYPYNGFFSTVNCYDILFENCTLTGRKPYYTKSNSTTMGSYDININTTANVTLKGCVQSNEITDKSKYWSVMCGNFVRNITYDGCRLSNIDAHQGVWGVKISNSTIGHTISMIGGGEIRMENTSKIAGAEFITFRSDYGSTWRGDVTVKNCTFIPNADVKSVAILSGKWREEWQDWNFGYDLYMPINVTVESFNCPIATSIFSWEGLTELALSCPKPLSATKTVTLINQNKVLALAEKGSYLYRLKSDGLLTVDGEII
jgi:hypothetical protein